jgi:hypothetical protein
MQVATLAFQESPPAEVKRLALSPSKMCMCVKLSVLCSKSNASLSSSSSSLLLLLLLLLLSAILALLHAVSGQIHMDEGGGGGLLNSFEDEDDILDLEEDSSDDLIAVASETGEQRVQERNETNLNTSQTSRLNIDYLESEKNWALVGAVSVLS